MGCLLEGSLNIGRHLLKIYEIGRLYSRGHLFEECSVVLNSPRENTHRPLHDIHYRINIVFLLQIERKKRLNKREKSVIGMRKEIKGLRQFWFRHYKLPFCIQAWLHPPFTKVAATKISGKFEILPT